MMISHSKPSLAKMMLECGKVSLCNNLGYLKAISSTYECQDLIKDRHVLGFAIVKGGR